MSASGRRWFAPVTTLEEADKTLRDVRNAFYVIAGMQALVMIVMRHYAGLGDSVLFVLFGYIAWRTKSRAVGLIMAGYTAVIFVLTVAQKAGVYTSVGGTNVVLGAITLYYGCRAAYATAKFHKIAETQINRRSVAVLSSIAVVLNIILLIGGLFVFALLGYDFDDNDSLVGAVVIGGAIAATVLVFFRALPFTRRFAGVVS